MASLDSSSRLPPSAGRLHDRGLLAMTDDRIVYDGRLGTRSARTLGAYAIYSSAEGPIRIRSNGQWSGEHDIQLVKPFTEHLVHAGRHITEILLETETVSEVEIEAWWQTLSPRGAGRATNRIAEAVRQCQGDPRALDEVGFDMLFFGKPFPKPKLDPRICAVINQICGAPSGPGFSVQDLAHGVGLSPSRLTHFFSEQTGTTIRRFRAWKRARMVMPIARQERNLLNLALEAGYADSTHFSHSMRSFFGMKARDLCEGSRSARMVFQPSNHGYASLGLVA